MELEARKTEFVQEFSRLQNVEIINELEKFLHIKKAELTEQNLKPMSMEQYNEEIDQAMDNCKNGRMIEVSDLKAK